MSVVIAEPLETGLVAAPSPRVPNIDSADTNGPSLVLVETQGRIRFNLGLLSTLIVVALFAGLFALAAMHSLVVQAQFELDRIESSVAERKSQIDERQVELARLESPTAVVAAAENLGMVEPTNQVYLVPRG